MNTADLRSLFSNLVRLESRLRAQVDGRLRSEVGVTVSQFEVLDAVFGTEDCQVRDIALALSLTTGGSSKLVDRLEELGLCERRPNPGDRRSSIVALTQEGIRRRAGACVIIEQVLREEIGAALPHGSLAELMSLLRALGAP
jgi:MarR family transcriptional regulator, organic hydroperoxide resistance regulator